MAGPMYTTYGATLSADELLRFLDHTLEVNLRAESAGRRKYPVCIWGRHGIGKTEIVRDYARSRGYAFAYVAPAQFEEMGDLLGMPQVESAASGGGLVTTFRPPDWVPVGEGPGILLLDDFNRADDRILRGLMQLLLDFRLLSWTLPPRWQIVLTANPEGGDYSVTPMDDALLTRLRHATLRFDVRDWARWAATAGVDERGIQFVLSFPDLVTGRRSTPRTLVQFFDAIAGISDLEGNLSLVRSLAAASLDEETAAGFVSFVRQGLDKFISPAALLGALDFQSEVRDTLEKRVKGPILRVDLLSALCTRLANHLRHNGLQAGERQAANLRSFLLLDFLPADLRLSLAQELAAIPDQRLRGLLSDPELGRLLLD